MQLLSMKYYLISKGEVIGYSELEGRDPSMGVASGEFYPGDGYADVSNVFRQRSEFLAANYYDGIPERAQKYDETEPEIDALELSLRTEGGETVGTKHISLDDFSDESVEEYQLSIVVDDRETYERFFQ